MPKIICQCKCIKKGQVKVKYLACQNNKLSNILSLLVLALISLHLNAAEVPYLNREVSIIAREQPVELFLQELFSQINLPVVIDENITGKVNATFVRKLASEVSSKIARSFGLVMYYDGAVVYVYSSRNLTRRILPASNAITKRIIRAASDLNISDKKNTIYQAIDGGLVVTGTRRFVEQVDELLYAANHSLKDYDPPVGFKVFYLKYAWAQDVTLTFAGRQVVIPGVATILRELVEDYSRGIILENKRDGLVSPTLPGLKGKGLNSIGDNDRIGLPDNIDKYKNNRNQLIDVGGVTYSNLASNKIGEVRIQADPRLNAIIVKDSPDKMPRYKYLIDALDVEPQMLEIEATIIDINTDKLKSMGINWRWQNDEDEILFGSGDESDLRLNPIGQITPTGRGGYISFVLGDNAKFIGRINALEVEGAANIVSRPNVLTLSNVEAIFDTSSTFYVRVAGREEVDLFNVSVGTSLRVTPHVFRDEGEERIKLLITIEDGQQTEQEVDGIPVVERSAINTQALINAGESVLIGGMVREVSRESEDKVPILGDIPVMGNLFKTSSKQSNRVERLFLISPRLSIQQVAHNSINERETIRSLDKNQFEIDNNNSESIKETDNNNKNSNRDVGKESWEIMLNM
jgi:type III secretion protein C